jgi:hypothetical protein
VERILAEDVTVGMGVSGALTPAGLGMAAIIPLMRAGFVDWIVSTGANLYHDTHFGIGLEMRRGRPISMTAFTRRRRRADLRHLLPLRRSAEDRHLLSRNDFRA